MHQDLSTDQKFVKEATGAGILSRKDSQKMLRPCIADSVDSFYRLSFRAFDLKKGKFVVTDAWTTGLLMEFEQSTYRAAPEQDWCLNVKKFWLGLQICLGERLARIQANLLLSRLTIIIIIRSGG